MQLARPYNSICRAKQKLVNPFLSEGPFPFKLNMLGLAYIFFNYCLRSTRQDLPHDK
jgi:hypothetical protein